VTSSRPPWEHAAGSPAAAGPVRIDAVVARRWTAAQDIVGLELHAVDGSSLSGYEPGAHIPVEVAPGVIRHYSLCDGSGGALRIAVLLDPNSRGGSAAVHRSLWPGTVVRIGPPRNDFPLVADVEHTILVAGGIGITPLIAMARALHEQQASFELHYCVRTLSRAAFLTELRTEGYRESVYVHLDDGPPDQRACLPGPGPASSCTSVAQRDSSTHCARRRRALAGPTIRSVSSGSAARRR
jgi:ferredoxin-NADP reductase